MLSARKKHAIDAWRLVWFGSWFSDEVTAAAVTSSADSVSGDFAGLDSPDSSLLL